jgi:DnaK suppressor protein
MQRLELERYRRILENQYQQLTATARQREAIEVERSPDLIDELQLATERELVIRELDRISRVLRDVKAALFRLDEGTFGICLRCERPISPARLNALPWAAFCTPCQQHVDEEESTGPDAAFDSFHRAA